GLRVTARFPNRLVVGVVGSSAAVERTFSVEIHDVLFRGERHYAAADDPRVPDALAGLVTGIVGLDDLVAMHPRVRSVEPVSAPHAALGASCCALSPTDLHVFYENTGGFDGSGETIAIAGVYAWKDTDNAAFATQWSLPVLPAGSGQVCTGASNAT